MNTELTYQDKYISADDVHIVEVLNNRSLDQNYIASLTDSMRDAGYLIQYPICIFSSGIFPEADTELPYIVACGAHRVLAARQAEIEVFARIYDGTAEDWIEMMSLDNFQFDPAQNSGIGQAFTMKEKRAACFQLLLLPKYLKKTNSALSTEWNTADTNIRRWRSDVQVLLETNSPKLRLWGVSTQRQEHLRAIFNSTDREDAEGNVVQIRKPPREATREEKEAMLDEIEKSAGDVYDDEGLNWLDRHDLEWKDVLEAAAKLLKIQYSKWYFYERASMAQLKKFHKWILEDDKDLLQHCKAMVSYRKRRAELNEKVEAAADTLIDAIHDRFCKGASTAKNSDRFRDLKNEFEKHAQGAGRPVEFRNYGYDSLSEDGCHTAIQGFQDALSDLEADATWVQTFEGEYIEKAQRTLEKTRGTWYAEKKNLVQALADYPRQIETAAVLYAADKKYYHTSGEHAKYMAREKISPRTDVNALERQIVSFRKIAEALRENDDWIRSIPSVEPTPSPNGGASDNKTAETVESLWEKITPAISLWKSERKGQGVGHASKTMFIAATKRFHDLPQDIETDVDLLERLLTLVCQRFGHSYTFERYIKMQCDGASVWKDDEMAADSEAAPQADSPIELTKVIIWYGDNSYVRFGGDHSEQPLDALTDSVKQQLLEIVKDQIG